MGTWPRASSPGARIPPLPGGPSRSPGCYRSGNAAPLRQGESDGVPRRRLHLPRAVAFRRTSDDEGGRHRAFLSSHEERYACAKRAG